MCKQCNCIARLVCGRSNNHRFVPTARVIETFKMKRVPAQRRDAQFGGLVALIERKGSSAGFLCISRQY